MLSHSRWKEIREELNTIRANGHAWSRWLDKAGRILNDAFLSEKAFAPEAIAQIYEDEVKPETVRRVMEKFVFEIGLA